MSITKNTAVSITATLAVTLTVFNANANDCSLYAKPQQAVKCLSKKVSQLEEQLRQRQISQLNVPKGAILNFLANSCPTGWNVYQPNQSAISQSEESSDTIQCYKR